jgi:hypothetical protein
LVPGARHLVELMRNDGTIVTPSALSSEGVIVFPPLDRCASRGAVQLRQGSGTAPHRALA